MLLLALGCLENRGSPDLGLCADYPEGTYDFGEVGIGTCLAGPLSMDWVEHEGERVLLVTNANPFLDFTGGSVTAYSVDRALTQGLAGDGRALTSDVALSALDMPSFPSYAALVPERDLLLAPNRFTEGARTRVGFDDLYFVDVSNVGSLSFAPVGPDGAESMELMSDPALVVYDADSQRAFVANLTSHNLSVLDLSGDTVSLVDARVRASGSLARFTDRDGSGSRAARSDFQVLSYELVEDEAWTLSWIDGSYRVWVAEAEGVTRLESTGDERWVASGFGQELNLDDPGDLVSAYADPSLSKLVVDNTYVTRMVWDDAGTLRGAVSDSYLGDWAYQVEAVLSPRDGEVLGGPHELVQDGLTWLFFDTADGIELAVSADTGAVPGDSDYSRRGVVLAGDYADPYVYFDGQADRWRMAFTSASGIGRATSTDLVEWTVDTEEMASGAAPVVAYGNFEFRMWTRHDDGVHVATSPDGLRWQEEGLVIPGDFVGGPALQATPAREWALAGDVHGPLALAGESGDIIVSGSVGFALQVSSGWSIAPEWGGSAAVNGVQADSWVGDEVYLTLTDANLAHSIGLAHWNEGRASLEEEPILEGQNGSFDAEGVSDAVVFELGAERVMLYAGELEGVVAIGRATSADGLTWTTDHTIAFDVGEEWDSVAVRPGSVVTEEDGSLTLWYTGFDGNRSRIGRATSTDGETWTRVPGPTQLWWLAAGPAGTFDDSAVRQPFVLVDDEGVEQLWYSGFDGDSWRIGHATMVEGAWLRSEDLDGQPRPVLSGVDGNFDALSAFRPVLRPEDDGTYTVLYTGQDALIPRVGRALALEPELLYRNPQRPTVGDTLVFETRAGDDGGDEAIPLERVVDGFATSGLALSFLHIDADRGFLYAASKVSPYIYVVDIREDFPGDNVLDLEAILVANTDIGSRAFRALLAPEGSRWLYAVNNAPESVMLFDLDVVEDDDRVQVYWDAVGGYLATPRGVEADEGDRTQSSIGPSQLALNGDLLYVANFNANSLSVYDLRLGMYGERIDDLELLGENPHALSLSPDGTLLAVAEYVGGVDQLQVNSSLSIVDVDPTSPTYLTVLTRLVNQ